MQNSIRPLYWFFLLSILTACGAPASIPEPTQTAIAPPTPAPATETAIISTDQPALSGDEGPIATPVPAPERASYTIKAALDYAAKTVSVDQALLYPNHSGETLNNPCCNQQYYACCQVYWSL